MRKSSQAGDPNTWATVDVMGTTGSSEATYVAFSGGSVFVVGQVSTTSGGVGAWTVRRQNSNGTWSTVDSYQETSGQPSKAESITVNANAIYVAGFAKGLVYLNGKKGKGTFTDYWVVRRSTDGGNTWTTVDKYKSPDGTFLTPNSLTTDSSGNIWVCGYTGSPSSSQWLVRKGTPGADGTVSWINSDLFKIGRGAAANGLTVDAAGQIYVTGNWVDELDGENWWLTRKLSVP